MLPYIVTIFLSAFLLFQVQPLLAKAILPWFGGSASVWTVCLMFFQVLLLLGYLYAHATTRHLAPKAQSLLHIGLLAVSLLFLPILPDAGWKPQGTEDPTFRIVLLLLVTVGLPYFLLSTTGSLLQAWFVRQRSDEQSMGGGVDGGVKIASPSSAPSSASVYRLYAVSNAGSLLALLSYPVGVEPYLPTSLQAWVWSGGYLLFALMCGGIAWSARNAAPLQSEVPTVEASVVQGEVSTEAAAKPEWKEHLLWALFVFTSTTLLLAVTSHLTQNIAPVPFLWIAPLSLYLLSFILCFGSATWIWKPFWLLLPPLAFAAMSFGLSRDAGDVWGIHQSLLAFLLGLFICCVVCHGELARSKPHPRYLTSYYLMVSLGGALGGVFVGLVAPMVFPLYHELPLALGLCIAIAMFSIYLPLFHYRRNAAWLVPVVALALILAYLTREGFSTTAGYRSVDRNFYGVLKVQEWEIKPGENHLLLVHGTIEHGAQILQPEERKLLGTTYYGPFSGVRLTLQVLENQPNLKVGVVGLGAGTLATYAKPGDLYRFYEINPLVVDIARRDFTFLQESKGDVEIVMGDARLSMEREEPQQYDMLAVDAFSGDAIPVHLLTKEAFELYFRHLKPNGVLAIHVSNQYLELEPVVERIAAALGKPCRIVESRERPEIAVNAASWILLTERPGFFNAGYLGQATKPIPPRPDVPVWTDDYSNLLQILESKE